MNKQQTTKNKKQGAVLLVVFCLLFIGYSLAPLNVLAADIVPCGTQFQIVDGVKVITNPCQPCHIFSLLQNVLNFLWKYISLPLVALFLSYGGLLMVVPGFSGNAKLYDKGKTIIANALLGLVIIFFSWLAIDTIIKVIAGQALGSGFPAFIPRSVDSGQPLWGPWNRVECSLASPTQNSAFISGGGQFGSSEASGSYVSSGRTKLSTSADCKDVLGNPVSAQTTFNEINSRRPITVCQNGCDTGKTKCAVNSNVTVNPNMLKALEVAALTHSFTVTSLTTGSHSANSPHYTGDAVDLVPAAKTLGAFENLRKFFDDPEIKNRYKVDSAICETATAVYKSCLDVPPGQKIKHIHVQFKR